MKPDAVEDEDVNPLLEAKTGGADGGRSSTVVEQAIAKAAPPSRLRLNPAATLKL